MGGDFLKELMERMPNWFYGAAAIIILIGITGIIILVALGMRRFSKEMGKDTKLQELHEKLQEEKENNRMNSDRASQFYGVISSIRPLIHRLNMVTQLLNGEEKMTELNILNGRLIDNLASDIKLRAGEKHRCGLWIENNRGLVLSVASSGFPNQYIHSRTLDIDHSVAGKSFRQKNIQNIPDVTTNDEWQRNESSITTYKSLICIPVGKWGILTIDGMHPMGDDILVIGQIYATMLEKSFMEYMRSFNDLHTDEEDVS